MHSENLRIDAESFLDLRCIDVLSQPYYFVVHVFYIVLTVKKYLPVIAFVKNICSYIYNYTVNTTLRP